MFGPDKCGEDYKLHFIFRHKNPKTGVYEEKHAKRPDADLKTYFTDKKTHLYTLSKKNCKFGGFLALPIYHSSKVINLQITISIDLIS